MSEVCRNQQCTSSIGSVQGPQLARRTPQPPQGTVARARRLSPSETLSVHLDLSVFFSIPESRVELCCPPAPHTPPPFPAGRTLATGPGPWLPRSFLAQPPSRCAAMPSWLGHGEPGSGSLAGQSRGLGPRF